MKNEEKLVIVFAGSAIEARLVKICLDEAGIQTALWDEEMAIIDLPIVTPAGVGAVKVVVAPGDEKKALDTMESIRESSDIQLEDDPIDPE